MSSTQQEFTGNANTSSDSKITTKPTKSTKAMNSSKRRSNSRSRRKKSVASTRFAKMTKPDMEQHIKSLEVEIERVSNIVTNLQNETVPKVKLKNETIMERLRWWYNDLSITERRIAHVVGVILTIAAAIGVFAGSKWFGQWLSGDSIQSVIIPAILAAISSLTGLTLQARSLKQPQKQ